MNNFIKMDKSVPLIIPVIILGLIITNFLFKTETETFIIDNTQVTKDSRGYEYIFYEEKTHKKTSIRVDKLLCNGTIIEIKRNIFKIEDWKIIGYTLE